MAQRRSYVLYSGFAERNHVQADESVLWADGELMRFSHTCHHMVSNLNWWPLSVAVQWTLKDSAVLLFTIHSSSLNLLKHFSSYLHLQMPCLPFLILARI